MSIGSIFKGLGSFVPSSVIEQGAREYLDQHFSSVGTVTALKIDSNRRQITLDAELKGETQPLHVVIDSYEITNTSEGTFIEIKQLTASREWMTALASTVLKDRKFKVPNLVGSLL